MKNSGKSELLIAAVFAAAMGILEAIVAYYLRLLYYPVGFSFPLATMPDEVLSAEMVREAATLVMLISVAFLTGKDKISRFVLFLFMFGIWDILYYLGLKVIVGWPGSLTTWDLLFLIPVPWVAPVLAPVICSLFFIMTGVVVMSFQQKGWNVSLCLREWALLLSGLVLILYTFLADFCRILFAQANDAGGSSRNISDLIEHYTPEKYRWGVFIIGAAMLFVSLFLTIVRVKRGQGKV
ncbi:MAG TPA: hypothetical protein PKH02_07155 [Bacteroidales bacterium]|nr:hypothetical protein [Bacteroidales bacterium]HPT11318.1 hypothetical protein [Bacteroidales bacterium]